MTFSDLTQLALLGLERLDPRSVAAGFPHGGQAAMSPAGTGPDAALATLQARIVGKPNEHLLLAQAALAGLHERIGALPVRDSSPAPPPAPPETQPCVPLPAHSLLLRLLSGEAPQLLPEWLELASATGCLVHPDALPALLTLGARHVELRPGIAGVLGHRGAWLAGQHPDGVWVLGTTAPDDSSWETGDLEARLAFLRHTRRTQPDRAREQLTQTWSQEAPEDRAPLVAILESGLSAADEPFLESVLDDRRKEVRRAAVRLLARLPDSRWAGRMRDRVTPLLAWVPGMPAGRLGLSQAKPAVLNVTLPSGCDKAMQRDGLEAKPPPGLGEKAGWLVQMLELLPLEHWTQSWQTTPAEIVTASQSGEWCQELLEGWTRAAILQGHSDWAEALFQAACTPPRANILPTLLQVLRPDQRESHLCPLLDADTPFLRPFYAPLLARCDHPWSEPFSRGMLRFLRRETHRESGDWTFRDQFPPLATRFSPAVLPDVLSGWPTDTAAWGFWSKGVDALLAAVQCRIEIRQEFAGVTETLPRRGAPQP